MRVLAATIPGHHDVGCAHAPAPTFAELVNAGAIRRARGAAIASLLRRLPRMVGPAPPALPTGPLRAVIERQISFVVPSFMASFLDLWFMS
jgi:hypothetical protein